MFILKWRKIIIWIEQLSPYFTGTSTYGTAPIKRVSVTFYSKGGMITAELKDDQGKTNNLEARALGQCVT